MDTPATLVPVTAEGWTLFAAGADHWLRDLDLAERADLAKPRDIRTTIKGALEDGALTIAGTAGDGPQVRIERTVVAIGSGASREADEYYLSEEAALLVVTRLRTPAAIALTRSIVRAFLAVVRGELPAPPPVAALPQALVDEGARMHDLAAAALRSGNLDEARRCMGAAYMLTRAPADEESPAAFDQGPYRARVLAVLPFKGTRAELALKAGGKATRTRAALAAMVGEGLVLEDAGRFARSPG